MQRSNFTRYRDNKRDKAGQTAGQTGQRDSRARKDFCPDVPGQSSGQDRPPLEAGVHPVPLISQGAVVESINTQTRQARTEEHKAKLAADPRFSAWFAMQAVK